MGRRCFDLLREQDGDPVACFSMARKDIGVLVRECLQISKTVCVGPFVADVDDSCGMRCFVCPSVAGIDADVVKFGNIPLECVAKRCD